jgi:outer membrane protein
MIKSIARLCIMMIFILSSGYVFAQEPQELSLQDLIQIALQNNSQLRIAEKRVKLSATNVTTAYANILPSINSSFSSGKYIQGERILKTDVPVGIDSLTGQAIYEQRDIRQAKTERQSHQARISLSQNIFDFGRSYYGIKEANALKNSAVHTMISTRQSVILNVKRAYYELLKAYGLEEVYQEAVKLAKEQVDRSQTMMDIGLASQAEVYQARVNLGSQRMKLITQQNLTEIAKANLNNALGRNPSTPIKVASNDGSQIFSEVDFDEAVNTALENNQEIKTLEMDAKANSYAINVEKARYLPTIGASVTYSRNNDDITRVYTSELNRDYTATIGIGADLNIFNGFSDKAAVQRASLNYQITLENLVEQKRLVTADVKQFFLELKAYTDILEIDQENIEAAQENLRLQQEKRRVGSGTELEVTEAQVGLTEAKSNYVNAEYDAKIAKANLEAAMGTIE